MAEKILNSYETIFIIDATLDEETVTALRISLQHLSNRTVNLNLLTNGAREDLLTKLMIEQKVSTIL